MGKRIELVNDCGEVYCVEIINNEIHITVNWRTEQGEQMTENLMKLTKPLIQQLREFLNQI